MSCPDSITPRMRRFLTLALMAVASNFWVSSGISSLFAIFVDLRAMSATSPFVAHRALIIRITSSTLSVHTTSTTPRAIGPTAMKRSSASECSTSYTSR